MLSTNINSSVQTPLVYAIVWPQHNLVFTGKCSVSLEWLRRLSWQGPVNPKSMEDSELQSLCIIGF
jgi:hypothetical protein